jgi:biotin operon repressor
MVVSGHSQGYELSDEGYKLNRESVKDKTRIGALQYQVLKLLAESGLRQFSLHELWKSLGVDRRRVHQAIVYLLRRGIVARVARGLYRLLVDPWELLGQAVVQGPNGKSVKDNYDTRSVVRATARYGDGVVGLFFDNVRGYTWSGSYVAGDRGRVLGREDLGRFARVSYAEVSVATGTRLFEGLGSVTIYFKCKFEGPRYICSDWVEWRPPSGFYSKHSVVEAVNVYRSKVLPYAFGLTARSGVIIGAGLERFRAAIYGLARQLYLVIRPRSSSSSSNGCRAPSVEPNGDGSFSVCFRCPSTLYRRLLNSARAARRDWNDIIVEVLSGVLP